MLRFVMILLVCCTPLGCSQYGGYTTRVPPPATGSYGTPNTYYPAANRTSAVTPESTSSVAEWHSVPETETNRTASLSAEVSDQPARVSTSAPRVRTTSAATQPSAPTTSSISSRLNGMKANEAKRSVAPASFQAPIDSTETTSDASLTKFNASSKSAPTKPSTSDALRNDSAAIRSDAWQSRSAPAPNRFAGG